jgi:hypothetical protein
MNIQKLRELLNNDVVTIVFTKKDGTRREMICTTMPSFLPDPGPYTSASVVNDNIVTVWDLESVAWRSLRFDSLISVETDYFNYVVES